MLWLWWALACGGAEDCPDTPDCALEACAATCDGDGDGAVDRALGGDDCDDRDAAVAPDAPELCDGRDNDCDGATDDADPDAALSDWYADLDQDGHGDPADALRACDPDGRVAAGDDCDDADAAVYPGAPNRCDAVPDNDCDDAVDADEQDDDGDGLSDCAGDCDDADPAVVPGAQEVCNDGVDDDCDGTADLDDASADVFSCPGYCPPWQEWDLSPKSIATYNPCLLDPNASWGCSTDPADPDTHTSGTRLHRVAYRTDLVQLRPQLLLWVPPGPGNFNDKLLKMGAHAGYRTVLVGYPNEELAWGYNCLHDFGSCYADGRQEIVWGDDTSPYLPLTPGDAIVGRMVALMVYLDGLDPTMGWGSYVNAAQDDLVWENVVVMGWSEGSTNLGWALHERDPHAAFLLSGPEDSIQEQSQPLASYMYEPFDTPGCAIWGAYHQDEKHQPFDLGWDLLGVPGAMEVFEAGAAPWGDTHRLSTFLTDFTRDDCTNHKAMAMDYCMDDALAEPYVHVLCAMGDLDRVVDCPR